MVKQEWTTTEYFFIPDDKVLDKSEHCRSCIMLFRCDMIRKFTLWGRGKGKFFEAVTEVQETTEETVGTVIIPDPVFTLDNQKYFREKIDEVIEVEEPYCHYDLKYFNFRCLMHEASKRMHRRVTKTTSVHEITREEYLEKLHPLQRVLAEANTQ